MQRQLSYVKINVQRVKRDKPGVHRPAAVKGTAAGVWPSRRSGLCSDLGEGGNRAGLEGVIAKPIPPMLLAVSEPHDHRPINVVGTRIPVWPMNRPCFRRVGTDAGVDAWVAV
jgi:hypothetical protein